MKRQTRQMMNTNETDLNTWMPGDGSLEQFIEEREAFLHPETANEPEETKWTTYVCGLDLGMRQDFSALAICEVRENRHFEKFFYVRGLKRFPLHQTYTKLAERVAKVDSQLRGDYTNITWAADLGGPGPGVLEILERKAPRMDLYKVLLTGGNAATWDGHEIRLSKSTLVSTLIAAFDADHIFLSSKSRELDNIKTELQNFEVRLSANDGRETYGGNVSEGHFDLLISLALAVYIGSELGARGPISW
jgi:hypothetical protein